MRFACRLDASYVSALFYARLVCLFVLTVGSHACAGSASQTAADDTQASGATEQATTSSAQSTSSSAQATTTTDDATHTTGGDANTTKAPVALVVPSLSAQSPTLQATTASGNTVKTPFVVFQDSAQSASSTLTGTNKQFEITSLDYDPCPFYYAHAQTSAGVYNYKVAPTTSFSFAGLYLVNGSAGTALTAGTYTVGATAGLQVVTDSHTSGINFDVDACHIGNFQGFSSGTVTIDALSTDGKHAPASGRFDLVTTDGGNLSGPFTVGHCTSGNTAYPIAPTPDPNACTL